ncbi:hypothetical protein CAEBREN_03824 [Caenorhabditis brenneri]|uniref:Uncharacterized protein n=1 Tax=Caenorhabditis brenneri TaxID=135651 RepID=G0MD79_CAEBE|nr:hypothetical protein CAEBREN_03824 [Caenorhabditis brenneri]
MVKYPTTPPKDFSWLGRPAPVPAPPPVQAPPTPTPPPPVQVKEEVPDTFQEDSFDGFPEGAQPYSREELFARMRERGGVQGPGAPVNGTPDSFDQFQADVAHASTPRPQSSAERAPATDFSAMMKQEAPQDPFLEPKQEPFALDVQEGAAPGFLTPTNTLAEPPIAHNVPQALNAENGQMVVAPQENLALPTNAVAPEPAVAEPTVESAVMNAIHQLMQTRDAMEVNIRRTNDGITLSVVKTPEKNDADQPAAENLANGIPDSQASDVVVRPRRRLRVVDPSDDEQSDQEEDEEELPETEPESDGDEENEGEVTPRKKSKGPQAQITPSPAKRLRTLNLNIPDSSDEEEDEDDTAGIDDSQAEENPFNDSYRDPEYIPDTQEMRDRPSDFRVPRNAVHDPLDLEY